QPHDHTIFVRVPGWAKPNAVLMVNDNRVSDAVEPGTFAAIRRTWKDGDRIQMELPLPLRLETVDANHPTLVSLLQGPLVLMAVADAQPTFDAQSLLNARRAEGAAGDFLATSEGGGQVTMRPFMSIDKESYSTYVRLKS